jgi:hypothetical protein
VSTQKPGRRRDCPEWCLTDHGKPLDPVHRGVAAEIERGTIHLVVVAESDPREPSPLADITAWDLAADTSAGLSLPPGPASELAAILAMLGHADVAEGLRAAVALLQEPGNDA